MATVGAIPDREEIKAYVRFEIAVVEDKEQTLKQGHYVGRNVEYVLITPPYSKDCVRIKVSGWLTQMDLDVHNGRFPPAWRDDYLKALQAWRNGQEMPLNGTPIRGWPVISPAQMEMLIRMNILTVEDLGGINDEGAKRIGMGALDLKNKAKAWLAQRADKGPLTVEVAALKNENATLKTSLETMRAQLEALSKRIEAHQAEAPAPRRRDTISADDILPDGDTEASTE